jgi:hypothetical protein
MSALHTALFVATLILGLSVYVRDDRSANLRRSTSDAYLLLAGLFCAIVGTLT